MNPYSANRRVACPGSYSLEKLYPVTEQSPSAREGKAAHWVATQMLQGNHMPGLTDPDGEPITKEMIEHGQLYWNSVMEVCPNRELLNIERTIDISNIIEGYTGVPDCYALRGTHLYIWDYKYGHSFVEVFENWQLLEYAAGILQTATITKITMTIVQPRCYNSEGQVRSWTIDAAKMYEYIGILQRAEREALNPAAAQRPSRHCNYCPARHACQALQQSALSAVDVAMDNTPWDLSPAQTGNELRYLMRAAALLDARITGLSEQARSMITRGELVPGFKLESGRSTERWNNPEEVLTLAELLGMELAKPREPITPNQARKLGVDESLLSAYAQRIPGSLKLVEAKDARKIFGGSKK